jgi:hypothetical protein
VCQGWLLSSKSAEEIELLKKCDKVGGSAQAVLHAAGLMSCNISVSDSAEVG